MKTAAIGKKWKRNESHLEGLNGSLATAIVQAGMGQFVQRGKETSRVKVVTNNLDSKKAIRSCRVHWRWLTEAQPRRQKQPVKGDVKWQIWQKHCNRALNPNSI